MTTGHAGVESRLPGESLRLGIIVSEYPKVTETFVLRDLVEFHERGHEIRLFHLAPFRKHEVLHDFARQTLEWNRPCSFLFEGRVLGALARAFFKRPVVLAKTLAQIVWAFRREPVLLAKSVALVPKALTFAEELADWPADHVHAEFAGHPATTAWIIGRFAGIPFSSSSHAHDIFLTQSLLDVKLSEAAFVRTISRYNERFLRDRVSRLREKPILVNHVGVRTDLIPALPPTGGDQFRILYVGSLEERKGLHYLIEALVIAGEELGDWHCDLLGGGPWRERLENQLRSTTIADHVIFHGPQPWEKVSEFTANASVLVAPSIILASGRTEGIPTVLIEALAHQRPVIATRVSGVPELVIESETGYLVDPEEPNQLARALVQVAKSPAEAHRLAVTGRKLVMDEFDLKKCAGEQLEWFARFSATRRGDDSDNKAVLEP